MSSTAENPSAGRTGSCPYTLASPGMSPRKSRTAGPFSFKSTPPVLIGQIRACRGFRRFRPPFIRTLVELHVHEPVSTGCKQRVSETLLFARLQERRRQPDRLIAVPEDPDLVLIACPPKMCLGRARPVVAVLRDR